MSAPEFTFPVVDGVISVAAAEAAHDAVAAALDAAVVAEAGLRAAADGVLTAGLAAETAAREGAEVALRSESGLLPVIGYGDGLASAVDDGEMAGLTVYLNLPPDADSVLAQLDIYANLAGSVTVFVANISGVNITPVSKSVVSLSVGLNRLRPAYPVAAGQIVGVNGNDVVRRTTGTTANQLTAGNAATAIGATVAGTSISTRYAINYRLSPVGSVLAVTAETETDVAALAADIEDVAGEIYTPPGDPGSVGWVGDVLAATADGVLTGPFNIVQTPVMPSAVTATELRVQSDIDGELRVRVYRAETIAPGATVQTVRQQQVSVVAGSNTIAINLDAEAGDRLGVQPAANMLRRIADTGPTVSFGGNSSLADFTVNNTSTTGFLFQIDYEPRESGLRVDVADHTTRIETLETEVAALQIGPAATGGARRAFALGPFATAQTVFVGVHGQSNAVGNATGITTRAEYGAQGFAKNDDTLAALSSTALDGKEYPGFGGAAKLRELMMFNGGPSQLVTGSEIIMGCSGFGGTAIADLDTGSIRYTAALDQLTAAAPDFHPGMFWIQGEQDATLGTTRATYKGLLIALAEDYDTDSRAIIAGANLRPTVAMQITSSLGWAPTQAQAWEIAMAQVEAARDEPLVVMAGAGYHLPFGDDRHWTAEGARMVGALLARAMIEFHGTGVKPEPLWVVESYAEGADIVLVYNKPDLVLDTTTVPLQTQHGFAVTDALSANVPCSVSVSSNTVRLTTAGAPAAGWGWTYGDLQAVGMAPYEGGAGNLRDSAGSGDTFDNQRLDDWAVLQEGVL